MSLSTQIWGRFCNCIKVQWVSLLKLENIVSFPWDPVDVPLDPMWPLGTSQVPPPPSTAFDPKIPSLIPFEPELKITKGPIKYLFLALSNIYGCRPHGTSYTSALTPWDPQDVPLDPKTKIVHQGINWSLRLYHSFLSCFEVNHTVHLISRTFLGLWVLFRIIEKCHDQALFRYDCSS